MKEKLPKFNPPEADKGLIPRPLGRIKITDGYPVARSGVVHWIQEGSLLCIIL
jgi:hypothetical protein